MRVSELIEELQKMPPDFEVVVLAYADDEARNYELDLYVSGQIRDPHGRVTNREAIGRAAPRLEGDGRLT